MTVRLSDEELADLDSRRKGMKRGDYLRLLLNHDTVRYESGDLRNEAGDALSAATQRRSRPPRGVEEVPLPGDPTPAPSTRHLHKFEQGEQVGYRQGEKVYRFTCDCGAVKEDTR